MVDKVVGGDLVIKESLVPLHPYGYGAPQAPMNI